MAHVNEQPQTEQAPRESETKFHLLFEKSPDAMLLLDGDVFIDCNQAAVEMMRCSSKEQLLTLCPSDISPEKQPDGRPSLEKADELIAAASKEGSLRFEWVHRTVDGTDFPVEVLLTAIPLHGRTVLHVAWRDISERKRAEEALRKSEANLRSLLENATNFVVYRVATDASEPYGGKIEMVSPSIKDIIGISDPYRFESWFENIHPENLPRVVEANRRAWEEGVPYSQSVRVFHTRKKEWIWLRTASTPVLDAESKLTHFNGLIVDITEQKRAEETLQLAYQTLEQRVEERTHEIERRRQVAEGLRDVLAILNSDRPLDEILDYIARQARRLLGASAGVIYRLEVAEELITVEAACGMPADFTAIETIPFTETEPNQAVLNRRLFAVPDLADRLKTAYPDDAELPPGLEEWKAVVGEHFRAYLSVPLIVRDEVYGVVSLYYHEPREFSDEEIGLATTLGDQAALAIENARLYKQAQELAVVEERSRLARDLHDAVTQTLFSASLIAEVLPRLWELNPDEGQRRLKELRELTRGALAEMRTLLLELRPAALVDAELSDLLRQLAESITGRARVPVAVEVEGECDLPVEVKVTLYRIAHEALNNVAKHAGASRATVNLCCAPPLSPPRAGGMKGGAVELRISDDGRGFNPQSTPPESLGLGIMRERAEAIGATLTMESEIGRGTEVTIEWRV